MDIEMNYWHEIIGKNLLNTMTLCYTVCALFKRPDTFNEGHRMIHSLQANIEHVRDVQNTHKHSSLHGYYIYFH